jgi:hypothetical protein
MTEDQLRAVVRDAIAQHARQAAPPAVPLPVVRQHASHAMFTVPAGAETGGPCVIEPAVACNHCGFCKSYRH